MTQTPRDAGAPDWPRLLRLDPTDFAPLYHQLKERLRSVAATLEPGTRLPSERELMSYSEVGRVTARKAVTDLVMEGLLSSKQGRGTFTSPHRVETRLERIEGFTETIRRLGHVPSTAVRSATHARAGHAIAEHLGLADEDEVLVIERLRLIDGEPAMVERTHLPAARFPDLLEADLSGSLYALLESRYGIRPGLASETIVAVSADRRLATALSVPPASPLLATARTTEDANGTRIEYTIRHARGDLCSFRVTMRGGSALSARSVTDALFLPSPVP